MIKLKYLYTIEDCLEVLRLLEQTELIGSNFHNQDTIQFQLYQEKL